MIIDTHVHIGGEAVGFCMNEDMVIQAMEKYGIDFSIVSNGDSVECDHKQKLLPENLQISQEESLLRNIRFARKFPDKIGVAPWVKPLTEGYNKDFEKLVCDNRDVIFAVKLHPFHSNVPPTDSRVLPYIELAERLGIPVVSHTGGSEPDDPEHLYEVAKMFPKVDFVMVHMGLGTDNEKALNLLGKAENLYGDTTWVPMSTTLSAIEKYGSKKMMFGSDMPIDGVDTYLQNPKGDRSIYRDYFHQLPKLISEKSYADLMYNNAVKVFGLNRKEMVE
ncbi:MAG: amidohydrolase family protein [Ruminococcus sp.]|nr:amidohydrolase family protein [Ruminococcus sp.]